MKQHCTARIEDLKLSDHAEVTVECGLTDTAHLNTHAARQTLEEGVTVTFTWPGEFQPAKEG